MDWMINYIRFAWKLACILRIYRTYNSTVGFSKYKFYNKLLNGVTLLRVIPDITLSKGGFLRIRIQLKNIEWCNIT